MEYIAIGANHSKMVIDMLLVVLSMTMVRKIVKHYKINSLPLHLDDKRTAINSHAKFFDRILFSWVWVVFGFK